VIIAKKHLKYSKLINSDVSYCLACAIGFILGYRDKAATV